MRGRILFNGNAGGELFDRISPVVLQPRDGRAPKVLLINAAWERTEHDDGGLRDGLRRHGVHDVTNLAVFSAFREFLDRRREVGDVFRELEALKDEVRKFYLERTGFFANLLRTGVRTARDRVPGFALGRLNERSPLRPGAALSTLELLENSLGRELVSSIDALVANDERMLQSLTEAEEQLLTRTGVRLDVEWRQTRARLEAKVLDADVVLLPGGNPEALLGALRFFDLRPSLLESLRRGTTLVATSAGALVLCERMIVYDNYSGDPHKRDFQLLDRGLGLVGGLQVLPHCMDRIQTDDADNLAYLARRFSSRTCAGLNQESYLLVDFAVPSATSVGEHDGVYVFGPDGHKARFGRGERIPL